MSTKKTTKANAKPKDESGEDQGNVATLDPPEGLSAEEAAYLEERLKELGLEAFLPNLEFTTEGVNPIVPGAEGENFRISDQERIIQRAELLASRPEWRDQFTYLRLESGTQGWVQFPNLHKRTTRPDPRIPEHTVNIPAVIARFSYFSYDSRLSKKIGVFCILDMPEVKQRGEYDPFYLKLLYESPSNADYPSVSRLIGDWKPSLDLYVQAEEARKKAEAAQRAPLSPRALKTGRDPRLLELTRKMTESRVKDAANGEKAILTE